MSAAALFACALAVAACAPGAGEPDPEPPLAVAFLIENGTYGSELAAPFDVFHHTPFHTDPGMRVFTVAPTLAPVRTFEGLRLTPDHDYASAPSIDVLVVPSAERHVRADFDDPALVAFVRERARSARYVLSLCDGAFVLAKAGLLDGATCTTFPGDVAKLSERYPAARVVDGVSFVVDGQIVTGSGGARSYDPALWLVERLYGETPAQGVARGLVIDWAAARVPHLVVGRESGRGYAVGDRIDPAAVVEDAAGAERRVLDLFGNGDRVLVLCLFGGGDAAGTARRGGLWCEDSLHEMALLAHVRARFAGKGVTFAAVACPPVYAEQPPARADFVAATERAVASGVVAFPEVWYDGSFRLLQRDVAAGDPSWVGRFRAPGELQRYGTPTLWILGRDGRVLAPPFYGNNYEKDVELRYTGREVAAAIERALSGR